MTMIDSFNDYIYKVKYCIQYIFIYFLLLLILFLLVIPVLNIYPYIMFIIVTMGIIIAYCYKSKLLSLVLVSLWLSYISSYILYKYLYDGLASDECLLIATLTLYFTIFISTCTTVPRIIEIKKPNKGLYAERELDLNLIITTIKKESVNILGIESFWGMGKSLIIDHLMYRERDFFAFIRIDVVALNIDDVLEYLVMQITSELERQYVFSKRSRNFISYINNFRYGQLLTKFLGNESTYSSELESFKTSIRKLNKPIIIIFEDLDRIDDKDVLRKIFYISERLTADLSGKLKVIYQYSAEEINLKGFDNHYLQKYIPNTVSLTHISFMKLFNYIIKGNSNEYEKVLRYKDLILDIINPSVSWAGELSDVITLNEQERYLAAAYNIRNIESFISILVFYINEFSEIIHNNKQFDEVLVKHCYMKCFLQNFYQSISTNIDIKWNFGIEFNNKVEFILDLIDIIKATEDPSKIKALFIPSIEPINFEKLLAFSILELYQYDIRFVDLFRSTRDSIFDFNYNGSSLEVRQDQKRSLLRLEHYFYYCIAVGNKAQESYVSFINEFVTNVLLSNDTISSYKHFAEYAYKAGKVKDVLNIETWRYIFEAFYYTAWNWDKDTINQYFDKLIQLYFKLYEVEYGRDSFSEILFKTLNIFLRSVLSYELKSAFFSMLKSLNSLKINKSYSGNVDYYIFQKRIIDILINLGYIELDKEISEGLTDIEYVKDYDFDTYNKIYSVIKAVCINYMDILEDNSAKYDLKVYLEQVNDIKRVVDKIIDLYSHDKLYNYDAEEDTKVFFNDEQLLSNEYLEEAINTNSIGVVRLCKVLKSE
ncbi:P-loop NTPase fold protein [Veillonella sp.]|uniref:P-loop NTPase fold protein n=1 Tax=Veillonella sp. TaxID=1926307 RepID=UPI003520F3EE